MLPVTMLQTSLKLFISASQGIASNPYLPASFVQKENAKNCESTAELYAAMSELEAGVSMAGVEP